MADGRTQARDSASHRGRHAVAEQEKRQRDTKKRAFPPSQPKKTEHRRKSAQKPNPNRRERRNLRQVNARQIGAGEKDNENKFTGIVMGQAKFYDKTEDTGESEATSSIGLLGYAKGKQSIWLDAETGKAVFGLPENKASQSNRYNEGRIELIPGGVSSVGNWKIGSRLLYNDPDRAGWTHLLYRLPGLYMYPEDLLQ